MEEMDDFECLGCPISPGRHGSQKNKDMQQLPPFFIDEDIWIGYQEKNVRFKHFITFDEAFQKCRQNIARGDKDSFPRTVSNGGRNISKEVHCMACCDPGVTCENMSIQYKGVSEKIDGRYISQRIAFYSFWYRGELMMALTRPCQSSKSGATFHGLLLFQRADGSLCEKAGLTSKFPCKATQASLATPGLTPAGPQKDINNDTTLVQDSEGEEEGASRVTGSKSRYPNRKPSRRSYAQPELDEIETVGSLSRSATLVNGCGKRRMDANCNIGRTSHKQQRRSAHPVSTHIKNENGEAEGNDETVDVSTSNTQGLHTFESELQEAARPRPVESTPDLVAPSQARMEYIRFLEKIYEAQPFVEDIPAVSAIINDEMPLMVRAGNVAGLRRLYGRLRATINCQEV